MNAEIIGLIETKTIPTKLKNPLETPFTGKYFQYFEITEQYLIHKNNRTCKVEYKKTGIYPSPYAYNLPASFKHGDIVELKRIGWNQLQIIQKVR